MAADELALLVTAATDAAERIDDTHDYHSKFAHLGAALTYALCANAVAIDRFARAIHPPSGGTP